MKQYLLTMGHNSIHPINHGLVDIDDKNYISGETPVEDFGMFIYQDEPFSDNDKDNINVFMELLEASRDCIICENCINIKVNQKEKADD